MLVLGIIEAMLFAIAYNVAFTFISGYNQIIDYNIENYNKQKLILYIKTYEDTNSKFCLNRKFEKTDFNIETLKQKGLNKSIVCYDNEKNSVLFRGKNNDIKQILIK